MTYLFIVVVALLGAFLYRLRGSQGLSLVGKPNIDLPRPTKQIFYSLCFATVTYYITKNWWATGIAEVLCVGAICMGHGAYMDLGHAVNPSQDQLDERPMNMFLPALLTSRYKQNSWTYDAIGLTFTGLFYTLPFAIVFLLYGQYEAMLLALIAGASKTLAYIISWENVMHKGTELGEWLTGFFQWGIFAFIAAPYFLKF